MTSEVTSNLGRGAHAPDSRQSQVSSAAYDQCENEYMQSVK